jgi:hypothetical protein
VLGQSLGVLGLRFGKSLEEAVLGADALGYGGQATVLAGAEPGFLVHALLQNGDASFMVFKGGGHRRLRNKSKGIGEAVEPSPTPILAQ